MPPRDQANHSLPQNESTLSAKVVLWLGRLAGSTPGVVLIFLGLSWAGVAFGAYIAHSNAIWIANGALLGILLYTRRKKWGIYLAATCIGSAILHIVTGFPPGRSVVYALANVAELYPAALLISWGEDRRPNLSRPKVLLRFLIATVGAPLLSAAVVELGSHITYYGPLYDGPRSWYFADVLGIAITTPLVLAFRLKHLQQLLQENLAESLGIWSVTAFAAYLICRQSSYPIFYWFFPLGLPGLLCTSD